MLNKIKPYRYFILFAALINLILTPLESTILNIDHSKLSLINYTLIILASLNTAYRKNVQFVTISAGIITLVFVWIEYFVSGSLASACRMFSALFLFSMVALILIRNFIDAKEVSLNIIFAAMAGYILIGIVGGVLFELLDYFYSESVNINVETGAFDYYYYSFISLLTVGFGDITPVSDAA